LHQQSVSGFHIFSAAAVKNSHPFHKSKKIGGHLRVAPRRRPDVAMKQDCLARTSATVANDQIFFLLRADRQFEYLFHRNRIFTQRLAVV